MLQLHNPLGDPAGITSKNIVCISISSVLIAAPLRFERLIQRLKHMHDAVLVHEIDFVPSYQ